MKKYIALILAMLMALSLCTACGGKSNPDPDMQTVTAAVRDAVDSENMSDIPETYLENMMGLSTDSYTECYARISSVGTNIDEFGVFRTDDPEALEEAMEAYLDYREEIWMEEYLPQEYPKLEKAEVWSAGSYVMYAILDTAAMDKAETAFKGCFEG